jgi:hypothetical protein
VCVAAIAALGLMGAARTGAVTEPGARIGAELTELTPPSCDAGVAIDGELVGGPPSAFASLGRPGPVSI